MRCVAKRIIFQYRSFLTRNNNNNNIRIHIDNLRSMSQAKRRRTSLSTSNPVDVDVDVNHHKIPKTIERCSWTKGKPFYDEYHDNEWGVPVHDDQKHFEMLILEGAQAGLSWETILLKREGYRKAFKNFDPVRVAQMSDEELEALREDAGIVRNKLKIYAARTNARVFLSIQEEFGTFDKYIWGFVNNKTIVRRPKTLADLPATTAESDSLSKDLKKRGMKFVGSTIMYAHMQATGLFDDHLVSCFKCKPK